MSFIARLRLTLLYAAPAFAMLLAALPPPSGLSAQAWDVAIIGTLMALWWASEIVPLAVTALLPVIAFPLLGVASIDETAASYAHPLIFLFLGGFLLSRAMER
ncbi:MAG TPA: SLC13 family permease, partial [Afifellaceae bacterium]|nr:SLC13 family permease [Afifellaceae bacterium]